MDLQPSGNIKEELLFIETDNIYFTIKGKNRNHEINLKRNGFKIKCIPEKSILNNIQDEIAYFFEYENYEIIIEKKKNCDISFYHESKNIRDKITKNRSGSLSGIINFKGEIGYSDLVIKVNGNNHLIINIEVFPSKITYREDYIHILNDVNEEIYNLAFDFLKRTYSLGGLSNNKLQTLGEYYSILLYIYKKLIKALNIIIKNPHHVLNKDKKVVPCYKIKHITNETIKWLEKRPEKLIKRNGRLIPKEAMQINKNVTLDTSENRFLKYILKRIVSKLKELKLRYLYLNRKKDELFIQNLDKMIKNISKYLISTFLKNIGEYDFKENSFLVFKMALGYKDVYKYYIVLKKGLTLKGELFKLAIKDLPLLYEYWCFLKINQLLRKKYKIVSNDIIKVRSNGIFVALKKGFQSKVVYENIENKERFVVSYNSKMSSKTVGQKPDNVLSINKLNGKVTYNYIFDAKYKLDRALNGSNYKKKYKKCGPKEEDINTMHRYRDAIVYKQKSDNGKEKNNIFGAFVLFPYKNEQEYRNHAFYKSIDEVNIGGIPFLPSATKLMEEFLDELIGESHISSFQRALEQVGKEYYIKKEYFKDRNVLIALLRNKEQLNIIKENRFYHIPIKNIKINKHKIKKIGIYQSKKLFKKDAGILYYADVINYDIVKRKDIKEIPKNFKSFEEKEELYIKFQLSNLKKLNNKIEIKNHNFGIMMYTTDYLLKNSEISSELCIKSEQEFRLWQEIKNLHKEIDCVLEYDSQNKVGLIKGFTLYNKQFLISKNKLKILCNEKLIKEFDLKEFNKNPWRILKKVKVLK